MDITRSDDDDDDDDDDAGRRVEYCASETKAERLGGTGAMRETTRDTGFARAPPLDAILLSRPLFTRPLSALGSTCLCCVRPSLL